MSGISLLAGLLLFFFSCLFGPESWDAMESACSTPRGVSTIVGDAEDDSGDLLSSESGLLYGFDQSMWSDIETQDATEYECTPLDGQASVVSSLLWLSFALTPSE